MPCGSRTHSGWISKMEKGSAMGSVIQGPISPRLNPNLIFAVNGRIIAGSEEFSLGLVGNGKDAYDHPRIRRDEMKLLSGA